MKLRLGSLVLAGFVLTFCGSLTGSLPAGAQGGGVNLALPAVFSFGISSLPNRAAGMKGSGIAWSYRYQYLTGGVNTGGGWAGWNPNGEFASLYMNDSAENGFVPVFTYYQILLSQPYVGGGEGAQVFVKLNNTGTMRDYYLDFRLLLDKVKAFGKPVIVHVEPDLSGYMQQRVAQSSNSAADVTTSVASSGVADLAGLPNTYAGFNQALVRLRDRYAPNAVLAMHASPWGTNLDVSTSKDKRLDVRATGVKTARFLESAGISGYDLLFVDVSDRDAGFHQLVNGDGGAHWWDETNVKVPNFDVFERYLGGLSAASGKKIMLWQVPIGNTKMRTVNNSWNHYQDNRVQYWLGGFPEDRRLAGLANSGVIAVLWGAGAAGNTTAEDTSGDGVTNPPAIGGNVRVATEPDDDGGYLKERMRAYYAAGPLSLSNLSTQPPVQTPLSTPTIPTSGAPSNSQPTAQPSLPQSEAPRSSSATLVVPAKASMTKTISIKRNGTYTLSFRAVSAGSPGKLTVSIDGVLVSETLSIPMASSAAKAKLFTTNPIRLKPGKHQVVFFNESGKVAISAFAVRAR